MTALTEERDTLEKASSLAMRHTLAVATGVVIYQGALVGLDAAGELIPCLGAAAFTPVGRASETVDNTAGGNDCDCRSGIFGWANDLVAPVSQADVGSVVYAEDDQTISTDAAKSPAGVLYEFDAVHGIVYVASTFPASQ